MKKTISVDESHVVRTGSVAALNISINGQNGVDTLAFTVPEGMEDWAWRVEIAQNGETGYVLLGSDLAWTVQAGELREGEAALQLVGSTQVDGETLVWKSRQFFARVLPAINAAEAMEPGEASELDRIAAEVKGDADRADAAAIRAEDAAAGAENIVNTAISDIEAEGQKQAAAVASGGTQALEAIGQVEQTAIAQVRAAGTTQVGAVEDAGDSKLAEINAANAHAPQINEEIGKWQVWDAQAGAYVDTDTDAQGPQGETGSTGPQGPAGADGIGLPVATAEDAGKVPVVGADGSYTLGDPVPEVDATLTEAGAPADAAAVGEAIEAISPDDAVVDGKPWTSQHIVDMLCPPLEASGNPVQCYPVAGYPLGVKASWEPRQSGEGDPSPDNIRPITGLDEVTVQRSGDSYFDFDGVELTVGTYSIASGEFVAGGNQEATGKYRIIPRSKIINVVPILLNARAFYWDESGDYISSEILPPNEEKSIPSNAAWFACQSATGGFSEGQKIVIYTAISYTPYTGTTATLSLPSTVYGGEVDLATGEVKEVWYKYALTGDENFEAFTRAHPNSFFFDINEHKNLGNSPQNAVCSHFKFEVGHYAEQTFFTQNPESVPNTVRVVFVLDQNVNSVELAKEFFAAQAAAGTPIMVAYKLVTPTSIQATGSQLLPALPGQNVLITNADSLTVTGRADPNHTIRTLSDRIAALEDEIAEGGTNA